MHHIHTLILDLTLITIYAGIMTLVCKKLKQPIVLGYVVAGILAGPFFNLSAFSPDFPVSPAEPSHKPEQPLSPLPHRY